MTDKAINEVIGTVKANIPEVEEPVWVDILPVIYKHCKKVDYFPEQKLIAVADNCDWIVGFLDGLQYRCDNEFFGPKPDKADGLLIFYDPREKGNKGYLITTKEAIERCMT